MGSSEKKASHRVEAHEWDGGGWIARWVHIDRCMDGAEVDELCVHPEN